MHDTLYCTQTVISLGRRTVSRSIRWLLVRWLVSRLHFNLVPHFLPLYLFIETKLAALFWSLVNHTSSNLLKKLKSGFSCFFHPFVGSLIREKKKKKRQNDLYKCLANKSFKLHVIQNTSQDEVLSTELNIS